jgi:dipeptidyl aminopeptidase/acylaminoacyl peptidase
MSIIMSAINMLRFPCAKSTIFLIAPIFANPKQRFSHASGIAAKVYDDARMKIARVSLACLVLLSLPVFCQTKSFTLEQIMGAPFSSELTAARRSGRIAWVMDLKGERNIWTADSPAFQAKQLTHYQGDDGQQILSLRLTSDGRTAVYARGSELGNGGHVANPASELKEPRQQVWAADVESGKTRLLGDMGCEQEDCADIQISPDGQWAVWAAKHHLWLAPVAGDKPAHQLTELRGDELDPQWSPDGQHLVFRSNRGDHSFIVVYDLSPARARYLAPTADRDRAPRWSSDGKQIVFIRSAGAENHQPLIPRRPTPWAVWIADASSGEAHELWHSTQEPNGSLPPFAEESLKLAAAGRVIFCSEQDGRNHLYSIPVAGGQPTLLTPGDFDVEDVELSHDGNTVFYTSNQNDADRRHVWRVSAAGGSPQALTQGKTMEWNPVMLGDGKTVVCLGSSFNLPGLPYRITENGREAIAANVVPADFPSAQLVEPQTVTFHSDDGLEIHGQLFIPRNHSQSTSGPALVFVHGGPIRQMMPGFHYMYYYHNSYAENQYLASQGYVVLSVNYRLGIMYGRAFREPPNTIWRGAAEYKDVLAGAKYLQGLSYVDRKRIGIWGGSYGGFLTAMALSRNSDIFAAGVDFHGVHDWSTFLRLSGDMAETAPDYQQAVKLAYDSSPVATAEQWKSPVLLIHGDDDRNVPFQQTTDLAQRLKKQHVEIEELIFPDEIHDFLLWKSWVQSYKATAAFFNRRLK